MGIHVYGGSSGYEMVAVVEVGFDDLSSRASDGGRSDCGIDSAVVGIHIDNGSSVYEM